MKKVIFALAVCATIVSCQKKEDTDPIDVSKTVYLMDHGWQLKVSTWLPDINDSTSFPVDQYTGLPSCTKDDILKFNTINRASIYEGASKCNVNNPDSVLYGYALTNNDSHLYMYTTPDEDTHTTLYDGEMTYPSIDTFVLTYLGRNPQDTTKTSRYVRTYAKIH
jgi:hypothetical protein